MIDCSRVIIFNSEFFGVFVYSNVVRLGVREVYLRIWFWFIGVNVNKICIRFLVFLK